MGVKIKTKKKPEPVPELPKEEPKKVLAVSSFQEQMNAIYQQQMESEKKRNIQKTTETNGVPAPSKNELPKSILKPEPKPTPKIEEPPKSILKSEPKALSKVEEPKKDPPKSILKPEHKPTAKIEEAKPILNAETKSTVENINKINDSQKKESSNLSEDGPSLADIRAQWKKNRQTERKEPKQEDFDLNTVMEDIMKKAEEKASQAKPSKNDDEHLTESMNEEIQWAIQQKKQHQEEILGTVKPESPQLEVNNLQTTIKSEEKNPTAVKPEASAPKSEKDNILNLVEIMEQKAEAKMIARIEKASKISEEEKRKNEEKELQEIEDAMSEEIRWAYEQKAAMMEEKRKIEEEEEARKKKEDEDNLKLSAVAEKYRAKEAAKLKEKEDSEKRKLEEKEKLDKIQKEAEEKLKKAKEAKKAKSEENKQIDDELSKVPRWKREKILRERSEKKQNESDKKHKVEEGDYLAESMNEEIQWALQQKREHQQKENKESSNIDPFKCNDASTKEKDSINSLLKKAEEKMEKIEKRQADKKAVSNGHIKEDAKSLAKNKRILLLLNLKYQHQNRKKTIYSI